MGCMGTDISNYLAIVQLCTRCKVGHPDNFELLSSLTLEEHPVTVNDFYY